nr:Os06g0190850 [Ipomoea batatas]
MLTVALFCSSIFKGTTTLELEEILDSSCTSLICDEEPSASGIFSLGSAELTRKTRMQDPVMPPVMAKSQLKHCNVTLVEPSLLPGPTAMPVKMKNTMLVSQSSLVRGFKKVHMLSTSSYAIGTIPNTPPSAKGSVKSAYFDRLAVIVTSPTAASKSSGPDSETPTENGSDELSAILLSRTSLPSLPLPTFSAASANAHKVSYAHSPKTLKSACLKPG